MKNYCLSIITLISIVVNIGVLSAPTVTISKRTLYCPDKIVCLDDNISSCRSSGGSYEYWNPPSNVFDEKIKKSEFIFTQSFASSDYHQLSNLGGGGCLYANDINQKIYVSEKFNSMIVAYNAKSTNWVGPRYTCYSNSPLECPFVAPSALGFRAIQHGYIYYANGVHVHDSGSYLWMKYLTYHAIEAACGGQKTCKIEIKPLIKQGQYYAEGVSVGYVLVDLSDNMKILELHPVIGYQFIQEIPFNTIRIKNN